MIKWNIRDHYDFVGGNPGQELVLTPPTDNATITLHILKTGAILMKND
jgi:hypothetical protein